MEVEKTEVAILNATSCNGIEEPFEEVRRAPHGKFESFRRSPRWQPAREPAVVVTMVRQVPGASFKDRSEVAFDSVQDIERCQ